MKAASTTGTLTYALVTPARNEAALIELTLRSVVAQTKPPIRWIIVSDASTDGTDQIVEQYARLHPWIELLRLEGGDGRNFARKAHAFNTGCERLRDTPCDIVGNLDADLSFDADFFAFLLEKFVEMPELGVAGAPYPYDGVQYDYRFADINDVSGCCQLFRRECLAEIGGYLPVEGGGLDWIAVATARMHGWTTRTFVERVAVHHRKMGSAGRGPWEVWFRRGQEDYALGGHPLWQLARCAYQSTSRPYVIGGLLLLAGYGHQVITRGQRPVSGELVQFHRAEQMRRLKRIAVGFLPSRGQPRNGPSSGDVSIDASIERVEKWVETHDYRGYEPFDGLTSYLRPLTFESQFLERIVQQVVRQSPINLRPLLGIRPLESTKGRGYMAWGYLSRLKLTGDERYREKAIACLEWLIRNKSPLYANHSWGNHFDYASRAGRYATHESIIVWTSLIGQAFLDAFEALGDERYLEVAKSACDWIVNLPREESATGTCLSYLASRQSSIHNANLLGAAMLARTAKHSRSAQLFDLARAAVAYSCAHQLPDGAWYYGEDPRYHWIDSFHTGYNLDSIQCYIDQTGDQTFRPQMDRGFRYFKQTFFEPSGRPKYYHNRAYPIDIQCAAQGIETLAKFAAHDSEALPTALEVARWTIRNMQDASGYFYYRMYPLAVARIPMLHWGQATMFRALALLLLKTEHENPRVGSMPSHA